MPVQSSNITYPINISQTYNETILPEASEDVTEEYCLEEYEQYICFISAWLSLAICFLTLFSNGVILIAFYKDPLKILCTPSGYLVLSLVISDVFSGLVVLPLAVAYFYTYAQGTDDKTLDIFYDSLSYFSMNASILISVFISASRYIAVKHPLKVQLIVNTKKIVTLNTIVWIYAMVFAALVPMGIDTQLYFLLDSILNTIVPLIIIIIFSVMVKKEFKKHVKSCVENFQKKDSEQMSTDLRTQRYILQQKQLCGTIVLVVLIFSVLWVPYTTFKGLEYYLEDPWSSKGYATGYYFTEVVAYIHCAINPCIYAIKMKKYRNSIKALLQSCVRRGRNTESERNSQSFIIANTTRANHSYVQDTKL